MGHGGTCARPEQARGAAGGWGAGEELLRLPAPRTGGCLPRPSPKGARDAWVSWAGAAGLRYFRNKSNQMRIYNPSWGLGSINLNSLGLGSAGAAKEEIVLRFLHAGLPSPFQNKSSKSLFHFTFTFEQPALEFPSRTIKTPLKSHCCPLNLFLVQKGEFEIKPNNGFEITFWILD